MMVSVPQGLDWERMVEEVRKRRTTGRSEKSKLRNDRTALAYGFKIPWLRPNTFRHLFT